MSSNILTQNFPIDILMNNNKIWKFIQRQGLRKFILKMELFSNRHTEKLVMEEVQISLKYENLRKWTKLKTKQFCKIKELILGYTLNIRISAIFVF